MGSCPLAHVQAANLTSALAGLWFPLETRALSTKAVGSFKIRDGLAE